MRDIASFWVKISMRGLGAEVWGPKDTNRADSPHVELGFSGMLVAVLGDRACFTTLIPSCWAHLPNMHFKFH